MATNCERQNLAILEDTWQNLLLQKFILDNAPAAQISETVLASWQTICWCLQENSVGLLGFKMASCNFLGDFCQEQACKGID